jgi:thioredoxin reductase
MTDMALPIAPTLASGVERMFPTLTAAQVERIAAHGHVRLIRAGEVLVEPRRQIVSFFVVRVGQIEIVRPPPLLETSLHGVFAVGDVRSGNIKRVASAVGEDSIAVSFVHQALSE